MQLLPTQRIFWFSVCFALLAVVVLAGCSVANQADTTPTDVADAAPTTPAEPPTATALPKGGNLTVRMANDVPSLRPWQPRSRAEEQITSLLYSGLVRLDAQLRPQPDLAEGWETTPDGRTITFTLRSGLQWHDGQPLAASDVQFTLDRLRSLPFTTTALLTDLRYIDTISTTNSTTIVLTLSERYAPLLARLALPILPRHLLENEDFAALDFWEIAVGSGPFKLADRDPGQSVVLERFEGYHRGAPLLDRVAFVLSTDPGVTLQALEDKQLLLAEVPWSLQESISNTVNDVRVGDYPENGYYFLGFNLREGRPFADVRVRQALALAVDVPRLVEAATKGQGVPIDNSALPGSWADLTPPPTSTTDLATARALLDEAGWVLPPDATIRQRDGITLTAELFVRGDDDRRVVAARRIAEVAASIGMQIDVEPADFQSVILSKYVSPYSFDLLLGSWLNGAGDPDYGDYVFYDPDDFQLFHSSQAQQGEGDPRATRNFVGFADGAYDNQSQAGRQLYKIEERVAAYTQTQARIAEQLPYLFLWDDRIPVALSTQVTTLDGPVDLDSPLYFWNIERWYIEN